MPVTERIMAAGSWDLALKPETPKEIRDRLDFFGHVMIFDAPVRSALPDATMISLARWAGIVRTRNSPFDLGGVNMNAWLGDEDGKGPILETKVGLHGANNHWNDYKTAILSQCPAVSSGISTNSIAPSATTDSEYQWMTAKAAFDALVTVLNMEYRVNPDASMDSAPLWTDPGSGGLFVQTPKAIVMRRSSGRDINVTGIPVTDLKTPIDADSYFSRTIIHHTSGFTGVSGSAVPYKDLLGNTVKITIVFDYSATTTSGSASAQATNLVQAGQLLHQQLSLSTDQYLITADVACGDWINAFDVDANLYDLTNPVRYRGEVLYPSKQRVLGIRWSVERGRGVWYRDLNGNWTDLTRFVLFEPAATTLEFGASSRQLLKG